MPRCAARPAKTCLEQQYQKYLYLIDGLRDSIAKPASSAKPCCQLPWFKPLPKAPGFVVAVGFPLRKALLSTSAPRPR